MLLSLSLERLLNEDFFSLLGLSALPEKEKEDITQLMTKSIEARVYLRVLQTLSLTEQEELKKVSGENLLSFAEEKGLDLAAISMEEVMKYRLELATTFQVAWVGVKA